MVKGFMKNKLGQGLPINIVVMMIIGIVIFGLGISMFYSMSSSGEEQINDLNAKIKTGIASLECNDEEWICSPSNEIRNGKSQTFEMFLLNRGDVNGKFKVEFLDIVNNEFDKDGCGKLSVFFPNINVNIASGEGARVPFIIKADKVTKTPCSFILTAKMSGVGDTKIDGKDSITTSVIVKVK